jgi:hypothetical protein
VQVISTHIDDINEIQTIKTSAQPKPEIQVISVTPAPGKSALSELNSFSVGLDTTSIGGSLQYSEKISAMACADGCPDSVSEILGRMDNFLERPNVTKSDMRPDGGYSYSITFPLSMKNVPQLTVLISDLPVDISTFQDGNVLSGFFLLEYHGEKTGRIPYDASEEQMETLLEELRTICDVSVTRSEADDQNGYTWDIEFPFSCNDGNVDQLIAHGDQLTTSSSAKDALVTVTTTVEGSLIQGSFVLGYGTWVQHTSFIR